MSAGPHWGGPPVSRQTGAMFRKHETFTEKLWRYRGVALVVAVPTLIILGMAWFMIPPPRPLPQDGVASAAMSTSAAATGAEGSGQTLYNIQLDAGSTGSRIHVFKFTKSGQELKLISDTFMQLKPGLSSYRDEPDKAAASLKPLLDKALATVPKELHSKTSLALQATAGLRLLPGSKAQDILEAVTADLKKTGFLVKEDAVGIMDGAHEGAFAWLTLNYLLGKLSSGDPTQTVAAIDLGGGSVQEAFALPDTEAAQAPEGYVTTLKSSGTTYSVYVHSYLGYGLMAARAKVIDAGVDADKGHPCFAKGKPVSYSYGDKEYQVREVVESGDFKRCAATVFKALDHDKDCGQPKEACGFSGSWRGKPGTMRRVYYVSSYFWDRALDSGIIADTKALSWKTTPGEFAKRAAAFCGKDPSELAKVAPGVPAAQAPFFCLDLAFCHTVLTQGFDLSENADFTLVKQVMYNGEPIEAAWPLGAAINDLSS